MPIVVWNTLIHIVFGFFACVLYNDVQIMKVNQQSHSVYIPVAKQHMTVYWVQMTKDLSFAIFSPHLLKDAIPSQY